jgi:hypothetical protein
VPYRTVAPRQGVFTAADAGVLSIRRVVHRSFPTGSVRPDDAVSLTCLRDATREAGVGFRREVLDRPGNPYSVMARALVGDLLDEHPRPGPVDFAILAYASPDSVPNQVTGPFLVAALPGHPTTFTVTDQGRAAPFTALALAQRYARRHRYRRLVVMLFDQSLLPYELPQVPAQRLDGDAAVAVVLERPDRGEDGAAPVASPGYHVRQVAGVGQADALARAAGLVDPHVLRRGPRVALGAGLDPRGTFPAECEDVWSGPPGYPCTGLWRYLADGPCTAGARPVVLVDYEAAGGDLCVLWSGAGERP